MSASSRAYETWLIPSSTMTSVLPSLLSISSTSPLIGKVVTFSGVSMAYHTHSVSLP